MRTRDFNSFVLSNFVGVVCDLLYESYFIANLYLFFLPLLLFLLLLRLLLLFMFCCYCFYCYCRY